MPAQMDITRHPNHSTMPLTIDIIIPTFRLQESILLAILELQQPENTQIQYYIISDNPTAILSPALQEAFNRPGVQFLQNEKNKGVSATRNRGMDTGTGDWILFLDDDIVPSKNILHEYASAIRSNPTEIGFIGQIHLPVPTRPFTKAVIASGSMDIFGIAERKNDFAWGATANIMFNRASIGNLRFSTEYPRTGGGEDVDFCYRVRDLNGGKNYKCLPKAAVVHPWWGNEGIIWTRPFFYGHGNSYLPSHIPAYSYYDFLNTPETLLISLLLLPILAIAGVVSWLSCLFFLLGILVIEAIATSIQLVKRSGNFSPSVLGYGIGLRFIYECGSLKGVLERKKWQELGLRFNFEGKRNPIQFYHTNTRRLIKWTLFPLLAFAVYYFSR